MGQVDSKFVNSDLKPSEVTETPWLYEKNDELEKKFNPGKDFGKWTMYFSIDEIDQKWFETRLAYKYVGCTTATEKDNTFSQLSIAVQTY